MDKKENNIKNNIRSNNIILGEPFISNEDIDIVIGYIKKYGKELEESKELEELEELSYGDLFYKKIEEDGLSYYKIWNMISDDIFLRFDISDNKIKNMEIFSVICLNLKKQGDDAFSISSFIKEILKNHDNNKSEKIEYKIFDFRKKKKENES